MANGQMVHVATIQLSHFHVSLVLLPALHHRHNCLVKKQFAVDSLVFTWLWNARNVSKSRHNYMYIVHEHNKALILKFIE